MKERKRPCALTAFSIRLGCVIFLFWLLGLAAITLAISQYIFQGLSEKGIDYAEYAAMVGGLDRLFSAEEEAAERRAQPGAAEYAMNRAIAHAERSIQPPSFAGYPGMSEKLSIFAANTCAVIQRSSFWIQRGKFCAAAVILSTLVIRVRKPGSRGRRKRLAAWLGSTSAMLRIRAMYACAASMDSCTVLTWMSFGLPAAGTVPASSRFRWRFWT